MWCSARASWRLIDHARLRRVAAASCSKACRQCSEQTYKVSPPSSFVTALARSILPRHAAQDAPEPRLGSSATTRSRYPSPPESSSRSGSCCAPRSEPSRCQAQAPSSPQRGSAQRSAATRPERRPGALSRLRQCPVCRRWRSARPVAPRLGPRATTSRAASRASDRGPRVRWVRWLRQRGQPTVAA